MQFLFFLFVFFLFDWNFKINIFLTSVQNFNFFLPSSDFFATPYLFRFKHSVVAAPKPRWLGAIPRSAFWRASRPLKPTGRRATPTRTRVLPSGGGTLHVDGSKPLLIPKAPILTWKNLGGRPISNTDLFSRIILGGFGMFLLQCTEGEFIVWHGCIKSAACCNGSLFYFPKPCLIPAFPTKKTPALIIADLFKQNSLPCAIVSAS